MKNLNEVSPELLSQLPGLAARWRGGEFDAAMFAAMYLLTWQIAMHGPQFASRKRRLDPRPEVNEWLSLLTAARVEGLHERLLDCFDRYQFRGVIGNIPAAMFQWLRGAWPLIVCEDIPSPRAVLAWQARGTRAVTVLTDGSRVREPTLNKRNAYEFFLHDLEHAYKFFHSPALYAGQRAFFLRLEAAVDRGVFVAYFDDVGFKEKFHYLMSDMNTHPEHSRQYLRAILIEFYLRRERQALTASLTPVAEREIEEVLRAVTVAPNETLPGCLPERRVTAPPLLVVNYAEALRDL